MFRSKKLRLFAIAIVAGVPLLAALARDASLDPRLRRARIEISHAKPPIKARRSQAPPLPEEEIEEDGAGLASEAIPYVGEVHTEIGADGNPVQYREIAPGYLDRGSPEEDLADYEPDSVELPSLPAHRTPVDPKVFGFASLADMEAKARRMFKIPNDQRVELWIEERNGKKGLAIDAVPQGPSGDEQPDSKTIEERQLRGEG